MELGIGDTCYIVREVYSDLWDAGPINFLEEAESIKVIKVKVTDINYLPIKRNGKLTGKMTARYSIESVYPYYNRFVRREKPLSACSLFTTTEAAESERQRLIKEVLKEAEREFGVALAEIRGLITE